MRKTTYLILFFLAGLGCGVHPFNAGIIHEAAAMETAVSVIVNEEAISQMQINDRMRLIIASSKMPDTPETRAKLVPQVKQMLIEEKLKTQEAKRFDIKVSDEEINDGIAQIAGQNNLTPDQFEQVLRAQKIPRRTLEDQVRSQIAWGKVVQSQLRPKVEVSENDIDNEISRLKEHMPEGADLPPREQVLNKIGMERLNRLQHRYMLDLKAEAFIENRG